MFISKSPKVGEKVRLTKNIEVFIGTVYAGSEFVIESFTSRGPNLKGDDGETLIECAFLGPYLEIWRGEWTPYLQRI